VAYSAAGTHVQTTLDYLTSFSRYINGDVHFVHVTHDAIMDFEIAAYDVVFHSYCARWPFEGHVSGHYGEALAGFRGLKILAIQDEYDRTGATKKSIADMGFDVVLTCIPQDQVERIYPRAEFPDVEFVTVLTGYVPEDLGVLVQYAQPLAARPTLLGYRGRDIGGRYGRLAFDKLEIGRRMREICQARGLPVDIDWTEESRIYGRDWFRFLGSCRATLGTESGSNVFDIDGSIERRFKAEAVALGHNPSYEEFLPVVAAKDQEMDIGQVSPRVFEAAALRTPMVLFAGRYSDVIRPDEHYIELAKDFSNVDEVLRKLEDIPALEAMADRAHNHLVASGAFSYPTYMAKLDALMDRKRTELQTRAKAPALAVAKTALERSDEERRWLIERPTPEPAEHLYFDVKAARREALIYRQEVDRLNQVYGAEIIRISQSHSADINRLVEELKRQDRVYTEEIAMLNRVYGAEIDRLRSIVAKLPAHMRETGPSAALLQLRGHKKGVWLRGQVGKLLVASGLPAALRGQRLAPLRRWAASMPLMGRLRHWLRRSLKD
jgi:hypothetical protein